MNSRGKVWADSLVRFSSWSTAQSYNIYSEVSSSVLNGVYFPESIIVLHKLEPEYNILIVEIFHREMLPNITTQIGQELPSTFLNDKNPYFNPGFCHLKP